MRRLVTAGLVTTLPRRVGGERAGSAGLVYTLDSGGQRWLDRAQERDEPARRRRPWTIGSQFTAHTLDVAELGVRLRERERAGSLRLLTYKAEPASWYSTERGTLKPDAYAIWDSEGWEQHRWIEVDRATESLPTIRRKLAAYARLAESGDPGPEGVLPTVLVTAPTPQRRQALTEVVHQLTRAAEPYIEIVDFALAFVERPPP